MNVLPCTEETLDAAADLLNRGGVAVIPTDTVYGLAAHPAHPAAVERLYAIKGRDARKPIALLAADAEAVAAFGAAMSSAVVALASERWPGALTLVLPVGEKRRERRFPEGGALVGESALSPLQYEGFRVPDHAWTRQLLAKCGGTLRVTSANLSGRRPATDAPQALADVGLSADLVIDDGVSPGGVPSTVVKVMPDGTLQTLRP